MGVQTLFLLDTHALFYRFFHALPPLTTPPPERAPIGAIYGLAVILVNIIEELKPTHLAAALDRPEPTFRDKLSPDYKAHRPAPPDELISQLKMLPAFLARAGVPAFSAPGYEADDVLGVLAEQLKKEQDLSIEIFSGDADLLQLVDDERVLVRLLKKGISDTVRYDAKAVQEQYGFPPLRIPDYKALVGDTSDNIKGVPGVGPKTAKELIAEFGTLEEVYESLGIVPKKTAERLAEAKEQAFLSRRLATIVRDVPLPPASLKDLVLSQDRSALAAYFRELGFASLVRRLAA